MYFNIARLDIQKLLVKDSRTKLVVLGFVSCAGRSTPVWLLISRLPSSKELVLVDCFSVAIIALLLLDPLIGKCH
jgi:hypothetical protein